MNFKTRPEIHYDNEFILATIKRRYFAYLIDATILSILLGCISIWFGISGLKISGPFEVEFEMQNTQPTIIAFFKILLGLTPIIYFTLSFYFWKGQTIGKRILRLRVISLYHEHLGLWHCFERSLGYYASTLEGGFGFIQAFWNPNRMALHDKIGETIVIKLQKRQVAIQQEIKI
jgi:uncharacterized RDD family membrane protein YckC